MTLKSEIKHPNTDKFIKNLNVIMNIAKSYIPHSNCHNPKYHKRVFTEVFF